MPTAQAIHPRHHIAVRKTGPLSLLQLLMKRVQGDKLFVSNAHACVCESGHDQHSGA